MIVISLGNLIYFLPEYVIATALSLIAFELVDRIRKPRVKFILQRKESFNAWIKHCSVLFSPLPPATELISAPECTLSVVSGSSYLSSSYRKRDPSYFIAIFMPYLHKFSQEQAAKNVPREKLLPMEHFYNDTTFYVYRTAFSIIVWSGAFLLITPFRYLRLFLPNFGTGIDLLVDVIMGVSIFEAIVTAIATSKGRNYSWILVTELLVIVVASASLFSPAMSWFRLEPILTQVEIYSLLIVFISLITVLAFLIGKKLYTFRVSFVLTILVYSLFTLTTVINIIIFIKGKI
ncbi:hypothetical protein Thermo_00042 [Thermoplasmatales archaeon]|nr:hypothetical protein Thermo_00042 [Thermoplasmatales archaeon]